MESPLQPPSHPWILLQTLLILAQTLIAAGALYLCHHRLREPVSAHKPARGPQPLTATIQARKESFELHHRLALPDDGLVQECRLTRRRRRRHGVGEGTSEEASLSGDESPASEQRKDPPVGTVPAEDSEGSEGDGLRSEKNGGARRMSKRHGREKGRVGGRDADRTARGK